MIFAFVTLQRAMSALVLLFIVGVFCLNSGSSSAAITVSRSTPNFTPSPSPVQTIQSTDAMRLSGGGTISEVAWSPDGTAIAVINERGLALLKLQDGTFRPYLVEHYAGATNVAWSPDGTQLALAYRYTVVPMIFVWDVASGSVLSVLSGSPFGRFRDVAWSPDGTRIAAGSTWFGTVQVWDVVSGEQLSVFKEPTTRSVPAIAWSPDGTRIVASGIEHDPDMSSVYDTVRIWDIASGTNLLKNVYGEWVFGLDWSPDGSYIAAGSANTLWVWDVTNGAVSLRLSVGLGSMEAVAWSPDGTRIAAGSEQHNYGQYYSIHVWDAVLGTELAVLMGHTGWIRSVAWSPDGTRLVSGGRDGIVRLWDIPSP